MMIAVKHRYSVWKFISLHWFEGKLIAPLKEAQKHQHGVHLSNQ